MSTAKFNQWLNSDGTENYKCRAWVNFNGTGTVAIRASGNVSSITDNGVGRYTANLTTAMADTNGAVVASGAGSAVNPSTSNGSYTAAFSTTSAVLVHTMNPTSNAAFDPEVVSVAIFR